MTAVVGHRCMSALALQLGWSATEVNHVLIVNAQTVEAWSISSPQAPGLLRTMADEDVAAVRALHDVEFPDTYYSASELAARVSRGDQIVLIADRGHGRQNDGCKIDGYIAGRIRPDGDAYIDFLAVAPSERRSGLGRRLVVTLCRQLVAESTTQRVCLTVQTTRSPARALYESLGFEQEIAIIGFEAPPR
ncbi:MAG: GNAT family N-acetyltransferase [Acidimicrobiales bacterium]